MTNEYIYATSGDNAGKLIEVPAQEAYEMKKDGSAFIVDMSDYNSLQQRADVALNNYKSLEKKLRTSDDPRLGTTEMREYELAEKWSELTSEIGAIDAEWYARKDSLTEYATQSATTATVATNDSDKQLAEQLSNRVALELASSASDGAQSDVLFKLGEDIDRLSDAQRVALMPELLKLGSVTRDGVDLTPVYRAARQLNSPEHAQLEAVKQFPSSPGAAFHTLKVAKMAGRGIGRL